MVESVPIVDLAIPNRARTAFANITKNRLTDIEKRMIPQMRVAFNDFLKEAAITAYKSSKLKGRGKLRQQLISDVKVVGTNINNLRGSINGPIYGRAHEYGALIKPKRAKALTVPLDYAKFSNGAPKRKSAASWRHLGTFILKRKNNSFIVYKLASGKIRYLYVLKKQVVLPARLGLRQTIKNNETQLLSAWGGTMVAEMLNTDIFGAMITGKANRIVTNRVQSVLYKFKPTAIAAKLLLRK